MTSQWCSAVSLMWCITHSMIPCLRPPASTCNALLNNDGLGLENEHAKRVSGMCSGDTKQKGKGWLRCEVLSGLSTCWSLVSTFAPSFIAREGQLEGKTFGAGAHVSAYLTTQGTMQIGTHGPTSVSLHVLPSFTSGLQGSRPPKWSDLSKMTVLHNATVKIR
jgi:hypothetical protein